jgi:hypothetical protein
MAIHAVSAVAWRAALADAVIETHDRIVGKTWQGAKKLCDAKIADAKTAVQETLRAFKSLGAALLDARSDGASLDQAAMSSRDTSVAQLAKELGVKPVTIYRYVGPNGELRENGRRVLAA